MAQDRAAKKDVADSTLMFPQLRRGRFIDLRSLACHLTTPLRQRAAG